MLSYWISSALRSLQPKVFQLVAFINATEYADMQYSKLKWKETGNAIAVQKAEPDWVKDAGTLNYFLLW